MATNKSGYNATLNIGGAITSVQDIRMEINHEPVDVTTLASTWRERVAGILDWRVTGTRNYASTSFLSKAKAGTTSVAITVTSPDASSTVFSSVGFITRGLAGFPTDASTEEVEVVSKGTAPVIA